MADAQSNQPPIIIKKIKKVAHGAHHGGSWKVAYADFVTAMMAFFLLLWLISATTEEQKKGIAEYFAPTIAKDTTSGSGGILGGRSLDSDGAMISDRQSPSVTVSLQEPGQSDEEAGQPSDMAMMDGYEYDADSPYEASDVADISAEAARQRLIEEEERQFREAEHQLRQAIQDIPDIQQLAQNLIIDHTPEGLRIQIVDQDRLSMFPRGSAVMVEQAHKLLELVAKVIERMPNQVSITGHTDSTQFSNSTSYTNWELSTDRANASRRALLAAGVPEDRIETVIGKADQEPLVDEDPASPRNRRISIVLLREAAPFGLLPGSALGSQAPSAGAQ